MDIEKLKHLKEEISDLKKRMAKLNKLSDDFEEIWDTMRQDCKFLNKEDDVCESNLVQCNKFPVSCYPAICPLDKP